MTQSQLLRSSVYCDHINKLTHSIDTTNFVLFFKKENVPFLQKLSFNILMSISEFDRQFHTWTHPLIDILFILLRSARINLSDNKITICDSITLEQDVLEAILFWMLLKFLMRSELLRLLPMAAKTPNQIVEPLNQFFIKASPYIYEAICNKTCGLLEAAPFLSSCFVGFFSLEETQEIWLASLTAKNAHDFFLCFVITGIVFSGDDLRTEADEIEESTKVMCLLKNSIAKYSLGFIISATLLLTEKSRIMIGIDVK